MDSRGILIRQIRRPRKASLTSPPPEQCLNRCDKDPSALGSSAGYPGAPPPAYPGDPPPAYPGAPPPGYGFQSGYSSGSQHYPRQQRATPGAGGGGFWTGLGTGGALGYLFGSQR